MTRREEGRTLILVDEEHTQTVFTDVLTREDQGVMVVSRGEEALRCLEREDVDMFIVELPGRDGDDRMAVLFALLQRALQPLLAIVAVTPTETDELRRSARDAGVIDFLSKPVDPIEVACSVRLILELRRLRTLAGWREKLRPKRHHHCCSVVDCIAEGIATIDTDERLDLVNSAAAEMFGYTMDEVVGRPVTDFLEDEQWRRVLPEKLERIRQGSVDRTEFPVRRKDGTTMWVLATGTPLYERGHYVGAVASFRDITLRHEAEEALRHSEQRVSLAMAAADLGLWSWDLVADTAYLSPEYLRMIGGQEPEIRSAGAWFEDLLHPEDRPLVMRTMEKHLQGETPQSVVEYRARRGSGGFIWVRGIGRVVARDRTGAPLRMTGVVADISEVCTVSPG